MKEEGREEEERYGGSSQFRPLLFVFGSARANQTTDDQNSIPAYIPFMANFLSPLTNSLTPYPLTGVPQALPRRIHFPTAVHEDGETHEKKNEECENER